MNNLEITPQNLYRLPWNLADNAISWLEPTSKCNLYCDGCYRENRNDSHKSLEDVRKDLEVFKTLRKTDSISIAGGEPLMHPEILEIVKIVKEMGWKPVINTNGELLTMELLRKLKDAGVIGFTFHVDSGQGRAGWKGKNETELNELRLKLAKMLAEIGGMTCSFNLTVYPENIQYVPQLIKWAQDHIDIVHVLVFIIYRIAVRNKDYDYFVGNEKLTFEEIAYSVDKDERRTDVTSLEVIEEIRKSEPDFMPCAFLNGTYKPDSFKWLLTGRMGNKHQIFGYVGPRFMELVQTVKHLFTDKYLAYADSKMNRRGRLYFWLSFMDKGIWKICKSYFRSLFTKPLAFFSKVHYQSIMIIQPIDVLKNGEMNMCDGCPDISVYNGELVWSCRMEELYKYDQWARVVIKDKEEVQN
jgi:MoaA/NifB/PqqE/SkfB family radical SAM enzyme